MKLSLSPHASVVVALLTFSLTMEFSDQSDTWVDVAALLVASCRPSLDSSLLCSTRCVRSGSSGVTTAMP